jgi:hypothetical protein
MKLNTLCDEIQKEYAFPPYIFYRGIVDFSRIMTEITVESIFGMKAGIVWEALKKNGPEQHWRHKAKATRRELVYGSLGWLVARAKFLWKGAEKAIVFSSRQSYEF